MRFSYRIDDDVELSLAEVRHAEEVYQLVKDNYDYLRQWLPWLDEDYALEHARDVIKQNLLNLSENKGFSMRILFQKRMAGNISYNFIDWRHRRTEIGYWLAAPFQGKGIMTKACRALIDNAFHEMKLNRVEICCVVENKRSRMIPERLGFTLEGVLRQGEWLHDSFHDLAVYSTLASEWRDKDSPSKTR
ncbi:MAG: GNAT family N-acetyltransferase [Pyrinomonadaceae bacterium]|nr:GNAT family N-acetyltransferase [Pyrinomonadaceae bacterium]